MTTSHSPAQRVDATSDGADGLFGVSFRTPLRAREFLFALQGLANGGDIALRDAVIVVKDEQGSVRVTETIDPQPGRAAVSGAVWTGLLGLILGGPVGWLAGLGIGAGVGALTAKLIDIGIPDEWVDWFKDAVQPGTATAVVLAANIHLGALSNEAQRFVGATLVHTTLTPAASSLLTEALTPGRRGC